MPFVSNSANFLGAWSIERRPEARARRAIAITLPRGYAGGEVQ
jgi:hypothetical protein